MPPSYLAPYQPSSGFGVNEHPLPDGAEIVQLQMLHRHGSRYPTPGTNVQAFGDRVLAAAQKFKAKGPLSFLNQWKYELGSGILVSKGRAIRSTPTPVVLWLLTCAQVVRNCLTRAFCTPTCTASCITRAARS